jgi:hypothetical protein
LRFPVSSTDKLVFLVLLKNAEMLNFSELPVKWSPDKILYLSNTRVDPLAPRNKLHITANAPGVNAATDFVKQSGPGYRFVVNGSLQPGEAKVKHLDTGILIDPVTLNAEGGKTSLSFNLSSLNSGRCVLKVNNVDTDEFYLINSSSAGSVLAVVDISLSSALETNYRVIEADRSLTAQRPSYEAIFPNRQAKWRYSIHLQADSPLSIELQKMTPAEKANFLANVNIETNDNLVSFQRVTASETDFVFESMQPLPLKEKYYSSNHPKDILNLRLRKYIGLGPPKEGDIRAFLPYPSTHQLDATNQASIYSNVFLTI